MEKIFERLLIEFLVPAIIMFVCIILIVDVVWWDSFNLNNEKDLEFLLKNPTILIIGTLFAYVINTSLSSLLNFLWRNWLGGKTREYLMYRKLDIFKEPIFEKEKIRWYRYIKNKENFQYKIDAAKLLATVNLYPILKDRLKENQVPEQCQYSIWDTYDVIRTLVMASQDNAIIAWIQYHWGQLRLARSTIVPGILLFFLLPAVAINWDMHWYQVVFMFFVGVIFLLIQSFHCYYRERFMIYAMLGYFLTRGGSRMGRTAAQELIEEKLE